MPVIETVATAHIMNDFLHRFAASNQQMPKVVETDILQQWNVKRGKTRTLTGRWFCGIFRNDTASNWSFSVDVRVDGVSIVNKALNAGDCVIGPRLDWDQADGEGLFSPRFVVSESQLQFVVTAGSNTGTYLAGFAAVRLDF